MSQNHHQPPAGQYQQRPRVSAADFRHEYEIPANVATIAVGIILLLLFGTLVNQFAAMIIPIGLAVLGVWLSNISHKGHMVQVGPQQFPHLHRMAEEIAFRLDMPIPHIYVKQSPVINAFAMGLIKPGNVVFHSALLENMNNEEVATVMAHEFGHIKCNHSLYMILQQMTVSGMLGNVIFTPIRWLFFFSSRMKEYSADRAALIGTMNIQACVTSEIKLSVGAKMYEQMNIQAYMQQIDEFNATAGSKIIEFLNDATHPFTVNRIQEILRFYRSPKYQQLAGTHGRAGTSTLTTGAAGTRDLFHRVAAKAEYERDVQVMRQGAATPGAVAPGYQQPAPQPVAQGPAPRPATPASISCGSCGVPLESYAKFCVRCGTPVAGTAAAPVQAQQVPEAAPQAQVVRRVVRATGGTGTPEPVQAPPAPQQITCPSCGTAAAPGIKFCGGCGHGFGA